MLLAGLSSVNAETLGETIRFTLNSHPEITRERAGRQAAIQDISAAQSEFFPKFDLEGNIGVELTDSPSTRGRGNGTVQMIRSEARGSLTQMIFDGFATPARVEGTRAQARAADFRLRAAAERLAFRVADIYLQVSRFRQLVEIAHVNVERHKKVFIDLRDLKASGIKTAVDVDRVASRLARTEREFEDVDGRRREVEARFLEITGMRPNVLAAPQRPSYEEPTTVKEAIARALENNPRIRVANESLNASRAEHELSYAGFFRSLNLELAGSTVDNQDGVSGQATDFTAMVRMRFNLFDGLATIAGSRRTFETARAAAADEGEARRQLREDVRTALETLKTARARIVPLKAGFANSKNVAVSYVEQFAVGKRSLIDLLDSANEVFTFGSNVIEAEYDVLRGSYLLAFQLGQMLNIFDTEVAGVQPVAAPHHSFRKFTWSPVSVAVRPTSP